ncbi:MAG: efflux RND transporter periplasmic adaptor subunit [Gammaproteobacteria bacterium]|nr:efflux RND transporter periplasmic adaptor subunit [Gammaproteobacteria bacterium]
MRQTWLGWITALTALPAAAGGLATYTVGAAAASGAYLATGSVEAVRQGTLGAQASGRVTAVLVRNGDAVRAGQALIRLEPGDALDTASAAGAAAAGAAARLASVRAEHERARQLHAQEYLSLAALQRAEAALRSAEAEARATAAQASAARTRAGWHTVTAPYAGRVMELLVTPGDLATPGRPLLALYDPTALRIVARVPESLAPRLRAAAPAQVVPRTAAAAASALPVVSWRVVPAVDPVSHSVEVRAELPAGTPLQPGQFASLRLPLTGAAPQLRVPRTAVLRRSEVTAVYVVDDRGLARLRQVRLGAPAGDDVQVLAGLQRGERVALDPVTAARTAAGASE